MGHIVNIVNKEGNLKGVADYSEICMVAAERYAEESSKHDHYIVMCILGEKRTGILSDIDQLHQRFFVMEEGKGIVGCYLRQKETPDSEWGGWKGGGF